MDPVNGSIRANSHSRRASCWVRELVGPCGDPDQRDEEYWEEEGQRQYPQDQMPTPSVYVFGRPPGVIGTLAVTDAASIRRPSGIRPGAAGPAVPTARAGVGVGEAGEPQAVAANTTTSTTMYFRITVLIEA